MTEPSDTVMALYEVSIWVIPIFISVVLHEIAHGVAALYFGDTTAKDNDRLSLNPIRHIDPFGTVFFPIMLVASGAPFTFGWAKPVPVNFGNLRNPKRDMVFVALAGPLTNFLLAVLSLVALASFKMLHISLSYWWLNFFVKMILMNFSLMVFNLLPILPLDGGRILTGILPMKWAIAFSKTERLGFMIAITILIVIPLLGDHFGYDFDFVRQFLGAAVQALTKTSAELFGLV